MAYLHRLATRHWVLLLIGFAFFYFYSGGGPNQGTRFNLDRAVLEQHRFTIDSYHNNTEDKAFYRGHYYCDKAPGTSLFALPPLAVTRALLLFVGIDPNGTQGASAQIHAATWFAATIPALFLCLLVFDWCRRSGYSRGAASYVALALGLASPLWAYATLFWGNALAACSLVLATRSVVKVIQQPFSPRASATARLAGIAAGWAVVTEFPTAPMAVVLFVVLITRLRPWSTHLPKLTAFGVGATAAALVLGTYNLLVFGSPFHLGYASVQGFEGMNRGLFGVTFPSIEAVAGIIWGPRGLLATAPLLVLGMTGHVLSLWRKSEKLKAALALTFSIYPVLLNVSYHYWDGGWSYGPRHSSAAFPFMAMGLAVWYDRLRTCVRPIALIALGGCIIFTAICIAVHGMTPWTIASPISEYYWQSFLAGRYARHTGWAEAGGPAVNLGLVLGLDRPYSLIPLWIGMALGLVGLAHSLQKHRA
jgi:hypothetical protein